MREIIIEKNDSGQRLDKFLSKKFKTMPKSLMYKYLRTKYIKVNGKKSRPEYMLSENDIITLYIKNEFFETKEEYDFMKASKKLDIIYEDDNIILIDKSVGVITHQDKKYDTDSLDLRLKRYLYEKGEYDPKSENSFSPALCNRLDRNTGGIVIGAKNAQALRDINEKIRKRKIKKYYLCITAGIPKKESAILHDYLTKDEKTNTVKVSKHESENSKEIITEYRVISTKKDLALCEVKLETGRTHQIRAHMSFIGCPLLGDEKYGDRKANRKYNLFSQALYSYRLYFNLDDGDSVINYLNGKSFESRAVWFVKNNEINL